MIPASSSQILFESNHVHNCASFYFVYVSASAKVSICLKLNLQFDSQVQLRNESAALEASRRAFVRERQAAESQALQGALMALPERAASFAREQITATATTASVEGEDGEVVVAATGVGPANTVADQLDSQENGNIADATAAAAAARAVEEVLSLLRPSRAKRSTDNTAQGRSSNSSNKGKNDIQSSSSSLSQSLRAGQRKSHPVALCGLRPDCEALLRASFKKLDPTGKGTVPAAQLLAVLQERPPPQAITNATNTNVAAPSGDDSNGPKPHSRHRHGKATAGGTGALRRVMEAWVGESAWVEALAYLANAFDRLSGQDADLTWGEFLLYFVPSDGDEHGGDEHDDYEHGGDDDESIHDGHDHKGEESNLRHQTIDGSKDEADASSAEALSAARALLSNLSVPELRQEASLLLAERAALRKQLAHAERRCERAGESAWQLHRRQISVLEAKSQQLSTAAARSQTDAAAAMSRAESASAQVLELQEQLRAVEARHQEVVGQASQSTAAKQAAEERADANAREARRASAAADVIQNEVADLRRTIAAAEVEAAAANRQLERTTEVCAQGDALL